MPTVSAASLLKQFNVGSGNAVLAAIGCGLEAKLLSERLGRHRTTFVLETEPLNLALALRLWDMSAGLRDWRIILLLAKDLAGLRGKFIAFCQSHPGLELPAKMLAWPWRAKADLQPWQGLLEDVARHVNRDRSQHLAQQISRLQQSYKPAAQPGAVAVLTTVANLLTCRAGEALVDGAKAAGFETIGCWPDSPLRAGHLAGLVASGEVASAGKNVQIVLIDQCRNHWPLQELPNRLVSWLVAAESLDETYKPAAGKEDWVVASTDKQREQLLSLGWPAGRIIASAPFVSPKAFDSPNDLPREGVILLHDLTAEDPQQAGVNLYSHKVLWQELRDRLNREPDAWQASQGQRWLTGAQVSTSTDLADPTVQEQFLGVVQRHLAPSVILSRAARAIVEAGLPLRIAGTGWQGLDWAKGIALGPMDSPQQRADLLRRAKVAIIGDIRPGQAWLALEAAAARTAIMSRALWPACDPAALFSPRKEMLVWAGQQELIERLRHVLRDEAARTHIAQQAHCRMFQDNSAAVRVRQVMDAVWSRDS